MQFMRFIALVAVFCAGTATAATISVTLASDTSSCESNGGGTCSFNGAGLDDDWGVGWSTTGGTSASVTGPGSTSQAFSIDAVAAADDGSSLDGDRNARGILSFGITLAIDVDNESDLWSVDLGQSALGLYALRGDGTASAVGTQNPGSGSITPFTVVVNGTNYNFSATPGSYSNNPSNNGSASQQFSGARNDSAILFGSGDASFSGTIAFDLNAISKEGCSSFICSSASGGEEAAVLFGAQGVIDQAVDDYGTWGRSVGPDGYIGTFTLNVVPEPTTASLLGLGLAGLALVRRRRN